MSSSLDMAKNQQGGGAKGQASKEHMQFLLKWALVFIIPLGVYAGCSMAGLAPKQVLFFTITMVALVLWALGLLSDSIVAITLPIMYIVAGLGKPGQVLSSWTSSVGWIVVGGLIFGLMMMQSGLAKRLAIWAMYVTRGSFSRLLWGILLAGFLIAPAIPSIMGKAALVSVICLGVCEALSLPRGSKEASAVMLAGFISIATSKVAFLTGAADVTMFVGQMSQTAGVTISWGDYFVHNFPLAVIYAILSMIVLQLVLRPKVNIDSDGYVNQARIELGGMKKDEKKTGVLILVLICLMLTDRWHGLDVGWIIIMLSFVAFLPPVGLMNDKKLNSIPLAAVFFVVGCMSIGAVAKTVGADMAVADAIKPLLEGSSGLSSMVMAYLAGTVLNLLLTPLAAFSAMTVPLTELAMQMDISPIPVLYSFSYGLEQYIFPYEYAPLLYFYATGWISLKHIIAVFAVRFVVALIFIVAVAYPYWQLIGLFN